MMVCFKKYPGILSLEDRTWPAGMTFLSLSSAHWMTLPVKVMLGQYCRNISNEYLA
jgi:hypothetical protein